MTEIEYESNTYKRVIDNECTNGVRGAAFIYRIKDVTDFGNIIMEEGGTSNNSLSEFTYLSGLSLTGLKKSAFIPYFSALTPIDYYNNSANASGMPRIFNFGTCSFGITPVSGGATDHIWIGSFSSPGSVSNHNGSRYYQTGGLSSYPFSDVGTYYPSPYITYSGNGFLMIETPVGYEVPGAGIRVKKVKTKNSSSEVYVQNYTYEDGVATNEMDRFSYQVLKTGCAGSVPRFDFLQPKSFDLFDFAPSVGYTKVILEDLGQINAYNGKVENIYITDPQAEGGQFSQDHALRSVFSETGAYAAPYKQCTINECVNAFSNIFGVVKESRLFDKNNNLLSKTVNEYAPTQQGAITENFFFEDNAYLQDNFPGYFMYQGYSSKTTYTVNILRNIPCILKSTTTHGMGVAEKNETLARDEITGETTAFRTSGMNNTASISYKVPAYKYFQFYASPLSTLDFTSPAFRTLLPLGNDVFTYNNTDTAVTPLSNVHGYSKSFLNAAYKLYANIIRKRHYDAATNTINAGQVTTSHYFNNRSFAFDGGIGSMDDFGLLKKSGLSINPLNLGTINNSLFWEPATAFNWKLLNEVTLIDQYERTVEIRDANNRFSASRYAYKGYYKSASASNCNYASFTFADFENGPWATGLSGKAVMDGDMIVNSANALVYNTGVLPAPHTGASSVKVTAGSPVTFKSASEKSPGGTLETGLQSGRVYRASVWVHDTNLSNARMVITMNGLANGNSVMDVHTAGAALNLATSINGWNLLQKDFEVPEDFSTGTNGEFKIELKTTSGDVYFDDFIFHPVEGSFSANVYDPPYRQDYV